MVPKDLDFLPLISIVGHDSASLAKGAEILSGIEAEATGVADCACFPAFVLCAVSLSGILDDKEAVCARELQNRIHVRRLSEKVNRNDRFGSCRETPLQLGRVHRERGFVHVDERRPSFAIRNGLGCRDECVRDRDDFIAFSNPKRYEGEPKRVRAIAHADGVLRAE